MADRTTPVLLCRLSTRLIGLPLAVETLSGAPPFVIGVSVVRGVPVPVVDAGRLLGARESRPGRFVTVRAGDRIVALAVDEVVGVRAILTESLQGLPPLLRDAGAEAIAGIGTLDAELLLVLHGTRLVPEDVMPALTPERAAP
jgi:purine-binding chemotaxis protein CheW